MSLRVTFGTFVSMALVGASIAACGAAVESTEISAGTRQPVVADRIAPPAGTMAVGVWAAPEGGGVVALSDGNFLLVDRDGNTSTVPRVSAPGVLDDERMVRALFDRAGEVIATLPSGAMLVANGGAARAELPTFLAVPTAYASWSGEALWATADGIFTSDGSRWWRLDDAQGAVTGTTQLATFCFSAGHDDAWVLSAGSVRRVRYEPGATMPTVQWLETSPGIDLGAVQSIAAMAPDRGAVASDHGLTVVASDFIHQFRYPQASSASASPDAVGGGGGWAWVIWNHTLFRTDGDRWESLVTDDALGPGSRVAVNASTGTAALVSDASGQIVRVVAEDTLWLNGARDGDVVIDPAVPLEAIPSGATPVRQIDYELDGMMLGSRTAAPWGWGTDGAATLARSMFQFGQHVARVTAHYDGHADITRTVHFTYTSAFGRVPVYGDLAGAFESHCARCHSHGSVASDLSTYDLLRARGPVLRNAIVQHRMPPDVLLGAPTIALFTAWIDGGMPQ